MKKEWHVVSFSGGKDSTAMLLKMIEENYRIDEIIFLDTGVEFPAMYDHIKKVEEYIGRPITKLKDEHSWEYYMLQHEKTRGKNKGQKGYSWSDFRNRWCTSNLKKKVIKKYLKKYEDYDIIEYHGMAYDEPQRIKDDPKIKYPLFEWKMLEKDALQYCYDRGFYWDGLYEKFHRLSCWCCPLKSMGELRILYNDFPELWAKMLEWDSKTYRKFRSDYTLPQLDEKFRKEKEKK